MRVLLCLLMLSSLCSPQDMILRPVRRTVAAGGGGATYVTGASAGDAASVGTIVSGTFNVSAGQTIIVVAWGGSTVTTGVTCNGQALTNSNLAWTASAYYARMWYLLNANAGTGVTCTATYDGSSTYRKIRVSVWSGIATSSAYLQGTCNTSTCDALTAAATTRTTANLTTSTANTAQIAFFLEWDYTVTYTAAANYTKDVQEDLIGTTDAVLSRNVTSTGTYPSGNVATTNTSDQYMGFYTVWAVQ